MQLVDLLSLLLEKNSFLFVPHISDIGISFGKLLLDGNPEMKISAALFMKNFSTIHKEKCGSAMKKVVVSLTENLKH
jgi:hypothetical protein